MSKIITPNKALWEKAKNTGQNTMLIVLKKYGHLGEVDGNFIKFCNDTAKDVNYLVKGLSVRSLHLPMLAPPLVLVFLTLRNCTVQVQ